MHELKKQVRRARRRLIIERFLRTLSWSLFLALFGAAVAIGVPKLFVLGIETSTWIWAWLLGGLGLGVVVAAVWTWFSCHRELDAAIEVDLRYGLKERVSSTLSLTTEEVQSDAGSALVKDAVRAVSRIDVRERFGVVLGKSAWLPVIPAVAAFCLIMFVDNKSLENQAGATTTSVVNKRVKNSTDKLLRKLIERRKRDTEKGLKDPEGVFQKLEEGARELSKKKDLDRKKALVKLNDLSRQLENRRKQLGGDNTIRQQLKQLKKMATGPADKLAKALKEGDMSKALDELKKLQEQIKSSDLSDEEKAQLAKQLAQMQDKMQKLADAHKSAMQELQKQIEQARRAGELAQANKLQQMLDKLAMQNPQMDQLEDLAAQLGKCAECMKKGDAKGAMNAMNQLALDMQEIDDALDELAMLEDAMDQIAQCKGNMGCKMCSGVGCAACQGMGHGMGEGQGRGPRPEEENDTNYYDSQVRQKPGKGRAVITQMVDGPNVKGQVMAEIRREIQSDVSQEADPLADRRLPRSHREHAKEFFDRFREGE